MYSHDALALYLRKAAGEPFRLSFTDCGMFVGDWVRQISGIDPCAELRGNYADPTPSGKNVAVIIRECADKVGFAETDIPRRGDVGSFIAGGKLGIGIFTGKAWAGKCETGIFVSKSALCLKAYRVTHV